MEKRTARYEFVIFFFHCVSLILRMMMELIDYFFGWIFHEKIITFFCTEVLDNVNGDKLSLKMEWGILMGMEY